MLTVLKKSSLASKYVYYRPENYGKEELHGIEMQNWNIQMDRAQRVGAKKGIIFLFIMFTPRVMVIKMSKLAYICIFCW